MNWKKLQNGSDIRGVALEGIEGEHVNLTPEVIETIAKSFVRWIRNNSDCETPTIAVGMDCRLSGSSIKSAFVKGAVDHYQRACEGYGFGYGDGKSSAFQPQRT